MAKASNHQVAVKKLQDELKEVYRVVYQGNGKPSIITQLSDVTGKMKANHEQIETKLVNVYEKIGGLEVEIELKFKNITDVVTERFNNIAAQISGEFGRKRAESTNVWNFRTAVTTAALASITSFLVVLITDFLKRVH